MSTPPPLPSAPDFAARRARVEARIAAACARAGRAPDEVTLVAVAKTADEVALREAWDAGHRDFAHNRVQPLLAHYAVLPEARWRLIGPLQRNKARRAVERVRCIETVAEERLAASLRRLAAELRPGHPLPVLLQANLHPDDGRPGVPVASGPDGAEPLFRLAETLAAWPELQVEGLMTIAAAEAEPAALHRHFADLRELAKRLAASGLLPAEPCLSMGMSGDFEIAVEEGATLVRVGRALFPPAAEF